MATRLLWRDAQGREGSVDLVATDVYVGRAVECAVRTDDPMVSRRHARIFRTQAGWSIEDLGSANGIFFNEQQVRLHALGHGDAVRCGNLWVRYVAEAARAGAGHAAAPAPFPSAAGPPPAQPPPPLSPFVGGPTPFPGALPLAAPYQPPSSTPAAVPAPPFVPAAAAVAPPAAARPGDAGEVARLTRRVEQLQSELRLLRGGGERAAQMEQLEAKSARLEAENADLVAKLTTAQGALASEQGDVKVQRAAQVVQLAREVAAQVNDELSALRSSLLASQGEIEAYASVLPRASFELVREELRNALARVEDAKDHVRKLRDAGRLAR